MSHITKCAFEVKDLDALEQACKRLGLELNRGQKTYRWYGRWANDYSAADAAHLNGVKPEDYGKCDHAISVKNNPEAYEVGLIKQVNGSYALVWDFWQGGYGLADCVSYDIGRKNRETQKGASKLKDWYTAEVARKQMARKGFRVTTQQLNGKVQVLCRK